MDKYKIKEIINFLLSPNDNSEGYYLLLSVFNQTFSKFKFTDDEVSDAYHDFLNNKVWNNEKMLSFIKNHSEKESFYYIVGSIKKFIVTYWNKNKKYNDTLSLNNKISNSDDEHITNIKYEEINNEIKYEAFFLLNILETKLDEKKKKILCQFLFGENKDFKLDMKKDAFYKAVERLKKNLIEIVLENKFTQESVDFLFGNIFVSEICEQFG